MKIEHTTYEETHVALPHLYKRLSASRKVRGFISRRMSRNFDTPPQQLASHHGEEGRPTTVFPHFGGSKDSLTLSRGESRNEKEVEQIKESPVQKHRFEKENRKMAKVLASATSSGSYLPPKSPAGSSLSKTKGKGRAGFMIPSLKKKGTFSELVKEKISRKADVGLDVSGAREEKSEKMNKIYNLRKAMLEGKLERVVPPPSANVSSGQNRRPPPRPAYNPFIDHVSSAGSVSSHQPPTTQIPSSRTSLKSSRPTSRNKKVKTKTKTAGGRLKNLIGSSADMMDETRREIQGKFRPPFEHMNYPSFSLGRKEDVDVEGDRTSDSDESFFCLGDVDGRGVVEGKGGGSGNGNGNGNRGLGERIHKDEMPRPKTRGKGSERRESHALQVSAEEVPKKCKLCGLGHVTSMPGLCQECEADLLPLRQHIPTAEVAITYSDSEYEDDIVHDTDTGDDDIPPTLPLKIRKQVLPSNKQEPGLDRLEQDVVKRTNPYAFQDSDSDDQRPPVPPKDKDNAIHGLSLSSQAYKPSITPRDLTRPNSQQAKIEVEIASEIQSTMALFSGSGWQDERVSPSYEEAQRMLDRWSVCFGDGAVEGMRESEAKAAEFDKDGFPLVTARDCDGLKRDSEFYKFWDEVLKEHSPKTPRAAGG